LIERKLLYMKPREDINMKKTFYAFVLLFLCAGFAAAADSAVNQAHRANADGALTNAIGNSPEALRHGAGLNFDTSNPVKVNKKGKGPTKKYTYTKPNGKTYDIDLNNNVPQPSEAVDATNETADQKNNSAKTNAQNNTPAKTNTQNNNSAKTNTQNNTSAKTNTANQEPDSEVPYYQQLKEWAAKHKDPNDPEGDYGRKRETHLRDYSVEQEDNIKPQTQNKKTYKHLKPGEENLPTEEKDRLEKSRKQAAKKKAQSEQAPETEEEWVDPLKKAKTQAEVREILKKRVLNPEFKQYLKENGVGEDEFIDRLIAGYKEYQRPDYTGPVAKQKEQQKQQDQNDNSEEQAKIQMTQGLRNLCIVKGIDPNKLKMVSNQPVNQPANNQVKTVKKFKLAADIIKADKRLSEKEKQEFLEWDAKIRRQAEELKEQERLEQERQERAKQEEQERKNREFDERMKRLAAEVKEGDLKYGNFNQICDPKIKNSSSEACAMCCFHPQLSLPRFDPKIHQMTDGYIDSSTGVCHCKWQGKPLTGYDTRNTSNEACTAYCLAHPDDIKGFNPEKHQVHYGELKKGECKCYYIKKDLDICSYQVANKTDGACARCCTERPIDNHFNHGTFDPAIHNMTTGFTTKVGGCRCWFDYKPGLGEHTHATVMGKHKAALVAEPSDSPYVQAVCNPHTVNKDQVECMKCCLAKTPSEPASGYVFDYGFLNEGQCRCHFKNTNKVDVCDNDAKLQSNSACYECCKAQPPAGFDPSIHEIDNAYVLGNECKCSWRTIPQQTYDEEDEDDCSWETMTRSQADCDRCCTDPSQKLVGGELEGGTCVCLRDW